MPLHNALPANPFDVVVRLHRQFIAPTLAAAAQDFAPVSGGVARTKAVDANPSANFRLIRTLGGHSFLPHCEEDDIAYLRLIQLTGYASYGNLTLAGVSGQRHG